VSVLAPVLRGNPHGALVEWLDRHTASLYLPTVTVAEVISGIAKLRRAGALRRADAFEEWLETILDAFSRRVLPLDIAAARATGLLQDRAWSTGQTIGFGDIAIAGIAMANGLTVLTRNLRHFAPLGVPALDPFGELPE